MIKLVFCPRNNFTVIIQEFVRRDKLRIHEERHFGHRSVKCPKCKESMDKYDV